jgi:hypothetical protein
MSPVSAADLFVIRAQAARRGRAGKMQPSKKGFFVPAESPRKPLDN